MKHDFIHRGAVEQLKSIVKEYNSPKIFLITGKKSYEESGAETKISSLLKNFEVVHFNGFRTNPILSDVLEGIELFNTHHCNIIISVGGGSVIDMGKLINYFHTVPKPHLISSQNISNPNFKPKTHIAIPTTAGSGSEATQFAVLYIGDTKYSIDHTELKPNYVIIDPNLHHSQTPYQIAVSGADAFAQAVESYWSINSTSESRGYAQKAIQTIWESLPLAFQKNESNAFLKMAEAAHLAGKAINITRTTAPHALSYAFTSQLGIPHGHASALTIPYFLKYNYQVNQNDLNDSRGVAFVKERIEEICKFIHADNIDSAFTKLINFYQKIEIELSLREMNTPHEQLKHILSRVNTERMKNNPRKPNFEHLEKYLANN